jgi:hypothetical protein
VDDEHEYEEFTTKRRDSITVEVEPWGSVEVQAVEEVVVHADVGGWRWDARGGDRAQALRRLQERLHRRSPFFGADTDWGPPGEASGDELAEAIPLHVRKWMRAYQSTLDPNMVPDVEAEEVEWPEPTA